MQTLLLTLLNFVREGLQAQVAPQPTLCADGKQRVVIRDGFKLETLPTRPALSVRHKFGDLDSIAGWLTAHSDPKRTHVLVGKEAVRASVDPRDPSTDVVSLPWETHPALQPWLNACADQLDAEDLFTLIREQQAAVVGDARAIMSGVSNVSLIETKDVKLQLDPATGSVIASGNSGGKALTGTVPAEISIHTPVLLGVRSADGHEFCYGQRVLVKWSSGRDGGLVFKLSMPDLPVVRLDALAGAAARLRELLPNHLVGVGEHATSEHAALPTLAHRLRADRTEDGQAVPPLQVHVFVDDASQADTASGPSEPPAA